MNEPQAYYALALQPTCRAVNADPDAATARVRMLDTLERQLFELYASSYGGATADD